LNVKVSGIGLVIDTCQDTSLPLTVPSAMSVVLPSASCLPVSVAPEVESVECYAAHHGRIHREVPGAVCRHCRDPFENRTKPH
jgi:hypothetical protein